jgi:hypothetical protein
MNVLTLPYVLPPYTKPHYRWSRSAGVWVLQGLHRLAPVEVFPSNLRPRYDARGLYINPFNLGGERYEPGWDPSCDGLRDVRGAYSA